MVMWGCVWLCRAIYGFWAMYGYVRLCMAMYGYVGLCRAEYGYVGLCKAMVSNLCRILRASLCKILISSFAHKMDFAHNLSVDFF